MKDNVTLLSGHSGVGKSTLVNAIDPNLDLLTQQVSDAHQKVCTPLLLQRCLN